MATLDQDEFELLARVAHRYHVDGLTQSAIARELGLSRPKIQRLLDRARSSGVVDVHVEMPPWLHLELEAQLRDRFGLVDVVVTTSRTGPDAQREEAARAAGRYLERRVGDDAIVAVSHGRDVAEAARFFRPRHRIDCTFVSAMGGAPRMDSPTNPNEIARTFADRCGARAISLYAPAFVATSGIRDQLVEEASVRDALRMAAAASIAIVGIGGTDDDCTMVESGCFAVDEIRRLRNVGAVGDVLGNYVDVQGRPVVTTQTGRLVGLSIEDLRAIETVVAVVSEPEKPRAILGVLRTGVVRALIVDQDNARMVLALSGGELASAAASEGDRIA